MAGPLTEKLVKAGHNVWRSYNQNTPEPISGVVDFQWDASQPFDYDDLPEVIDGLVYLPGAIRLAPFHRIPEEDFRSDFELQVLGAIRILQKAMPSLKKSESASVVLVSTVAVQTGFPFHAQVASSKGAIEGLVRSLAAEWAPVVRVNGIAPSLTHTPLAGKLLDNEKISGKHLRIDCAVRNHDNPCRSLIQGTHNVDIIIVETVFKNDDISIWKCIGHQGIRYLKGLCAQSKRNFRPQLCGIFNCKAAFLLNIQCTMVINFLRI